MYAYVDVFQGMENILIDLVLFAFYEYFWRYFVIKYVSTQHDIVPGTIFF